MLRGDPRPVPARSPNDRGLLDDIVEDPVDASEFPVPPAGVVIPEWIQGKMIGYAELSGPFADVRASRTIAHLRPQFIRRALVLGFEDFDAAALKSAYPRELTQQLASHLYDLVSENGSSVVDGIRFSSRHGDELIMWAIFERPGDDVTSQHLAHTSSQLVELDDVDLLHAMQLHGLTWPSG